MGDQIQAASSTAGLTAVFLIRNFAANVWQTTTNTFVTYVTGNRGDYEISMTEQGTASKYYAGTFDTDIPKGNYKVEVREATGEATNLMDFFEVLWDGTDLVESLTGLEVNVTQIDSDIKAPIQLKYFMTGVGAFLVDDSTFAPTSTQFEIKTDPALLQTPSAINGFFKDHELQISGSNQLISFVITQYDGINKRITIDRAAPETILADNNIFIFRRAPLTDSETTAIVDGSVTSITGDQIFWHPLIPESIGLGDPIAIGIAASNAQGDLPTVAEILPGTIRIQKRSLGDSGLTEILATTALPDIVDGMMTFTETFSTAAGYKEGDEIFITLAGQTVSVSGTDHKLTSVSGNVYETYVRNTIPQIFKDLYDNSFVTRISVDVVTDDGDFTIQAESGFTLSASNDTYNNIWLAFTTGNNNGVSKFISDYTGATRRVQFLGTQTGRDDQYPNAVVSGDKGYILGHN